MVRSGNSGRGVLHLVGKVPWCEDAHPITRPSTSVFMPTPHPKSHPAALPLGIGGHIDHADDIELGAQKSLVADGLQVGARFKEFEGPCQ